jgi:hypothetical protein
MKPYSISSELYVELAEDRLVIGGDLTRSNGPLLMQWLETQSAIGELDLAELDISDGVAATYAVNAVRLMLSRVPLLEIIHAPQVLAHNLYRTGLLEQGGIVLVAMREDEAYG